MSRLRVRLTIDRAIWNRSVEYAKATHRSPAELYEEAVEQMMARYPRRPREPDLAARVAELEKVIGIYGIGASRVPAGTSGADLGRG